MFVIVLCSVWLTNLLPMNPSRDLWHFEWLSISAVTDFGWRFFPSPLDGAIVVLTLRRCAANNSTKNILFTLIDILKAQFCCSIETATQKSDMIVCFPNLLFFLLHRDDDFKYLSNNFLCFALLLMILEGEKKSDTKRLMYGHVFIIIS